MNTDRGHTLIELMVAMVILGILSSIALVVFSGAPQKARDVQIQSDLRDVAGKIQAYAAQHGYPPDANPGIEPAPGITFPQREGRILDYDRSSPTDNIPCFNGRRWVKILSYPSTGRTDDYTNPGAIGEWTRTGNDWALTLSVGEC